MAIDIQLALTDWWKLQKLIRLRITLAVVIGVIVVVTLSPLHFSMSNVEKTAYSDVQQNFLTFIQFNGS